MLVCSKKYLFQRDTKGKLNISRRKTDQLIVSYKVTDPCCDLSVIFCGFISHLIGHKTINIPEIFSGVHGFTGKTGSEDIIKPPIGNLSQMFETTFDVLDRILLEIFWLYMQFLELKHNHMVATRGPTMLSKVNTPDMQCTLIQVSLLCLQYFSNFILLQRKQKLQTVCTMNKQIFRSSR